jgi:hypothetical protein
VIGQTATTVICGVVRIGHVMFAVFVAVIPEHKSLPVAVETLREEQLLGAM